MKDKIYAISILLSFLVVLGHEMIPHHHHYLEMDFISSFFDHNEQHSHYNKESHHHHDAGNHKHKPTTKSTKEHNHPYPFHQHLSDANDFNCLRSNLNRNLIVNVPLLTVLHSFTDTSLIDSPELNFVRFTDIPFKIKTIFEPGASGSRAPPSIT